VVQRMDNFLSLPAAAPAVTPLSAAVVKGCMHGHLQAPGRAPTKTVVWAVKWPMATSLRGFDGKGLPTDRLGSS
jgi:hypothetical protein